MTRKKQKKKDRRAKRRKTNGSETSISPHFRVSAGRLRSRNISCAVGEGWCKIVLHDEGKRHRRCSNSLDTEKHPKTALKSGALRIKNAFVMTDKVKLVL